jgi:di/tricarboxylate transporter
MIVTRCISTADARRAVSLDVLLTIAAAFGLGKALETSGAARVLADVVVSFTGQWGPTAALAMVYLVTICFTTLITNNATAVLVFPVAVAVATELGVAARPFAIAVAAAAAASFATPISYQTNMMVYGPGGYRFSDFLRVGLPLNLLLLIVALVVIPLVWPL